MFNKKKVRDLEEQIENLSRELTNVLQINSKLRAKIRQLTQSKSDTNGVTQGDVNVGEVRNVSSKNK